MPGCSVKGRDAAARQQMNQDRFKLKRETQESLHQEYSLLLDKYFQRRLLQVRLLGQKQNIFVCLLACLFSPLLSSLLAVPFPHFLFLSSLFLIYFLSFSSPPPQPTSPPLPFFPLYFPFLLPSLPFILLKTTIRCSITWLNPQSIQFFL